MIYPNEVPQEWAKKYGIRIKIKECANCKKDFLLDVPVAIKGYRGLEMRAHGCPIKYCGATFVPVGEEKEKWNDVLYEGF